MPATTLRPNQGFTTKATVTRGDTQLVSWIIFSGHNSDASNILEIHPKIGLELDHSFSAEGKFRLAAYHKEIQTKEDYQSTAELKHVDVEVKYNQLDGAKLLPKNPANFVSGDTLRKDFPCVFEAKFLIDPASSDELSRLKFSLSDGSRNTLHEGSQAGGVFTFTPQNSNAKYTVTAQYTDEFGAVSTQIFSGTSKALSVKDITHGEQVVRPGTSMSFSVTKTQFNFSIKNDSDLPENESIKWNLDKVLVGTGRTINIPGSRLIQKKKYHIEAFVTSAIGKTTGTNNDGINNDWHFEVKDNVVEKIKIVKSPKMGTAGEFEIEETTFKNYDPAKDGAIFWKVAGPETGTGSEAKFSKSFNLPGEYTISCNLGGRPCKEPLKINIIEPMVTVDQCKWIDRDTGSGNIIKQAGLNQEVSTFVAGNGLDNEDITLDIYDDDSTGNNIVFTNTFKTTEKHKTGFYFPLTITQEIVDKIKKQGFADRGDLYFNLVRNGAETPIKNGDKKLGEFLRVTLDPQIINAYFCDANDTEQVFSSPLNGALYFKIYAINMVDKKVEINFLTESDAYWTWDDELKIGKWEDIKDKFKDEKIRDTKTATFDKKGEILVPIDLSKIGKPKNFIRLNAMVKILKDKETTEKQEEKGFYMKHTDLAILFPGATLPTMVENKGAVKVGRAGIDGGEKEENGVCECEAKVRAFMRMIRIGEGTQDEGGYSRIVGGSTLNDHGKDFSDHPKVMIWIESIKDYSSAAGAYQITKKNWNDVGFATWRSNHVNDFSPESQDKYCVYLIKEKKKALNLIKNDDIKGAISKCSGEWASLPGAGYGQREEKIDNIIEKYNQYYQEELKGPTNHLHLKKGFLKEFGENCCEEVKAVDGDINKYRIDVDKFTCPKIMKNKTSKKYQYDIYENNNLIKSITLEKNEHELLPFAESGTNWGRFGTRDTGGDNWVNEKVCAALLGFFYSLPKNGYSGILYFNDISANDGRNIGHSGHNISGNDVDIRYPGSGNGGQTFWRDAMQAYGTEEKFIEVLENIISIGVKWGFNKNYAYKSSIKNTTGKATSVHQDHFHLGIR